MPEELLEESRNVVDCDVLGESDVRSSVKVLTELSKEKHVVLN